LTLEEQLAFFDRYFDQAYARSLRDFKHRKEEIRSRARQRLIDGEKVYGDQGFHWSYKRLDDEEMQEHSDAPMYRLMKMKQGWM